MQKLKTILKQRLKGAQRIAVLGIGSKFRADDAAGMIIAEKIIAYRKTNKTNSLKVFLGDTAPENLTGEIKKFAPTHLIIIDTVDLHMMPGTVKVINSSLETGAFFSTHRLPIHILQDYLFNSIGCETIIIGIQPKSLDLCGCVTRIMQKSIELIATEVIGVLYSKQ